MSEKELITIVEGPTPEFRPAVNPLFYSVLEGPNDADVALVELRTMNGQSILDRCTDAWREGRGVLLDYPDDMRLRQQLQVVSMRLEEWDSGGVLKLWVRQLVEQELDEFDEEEDDFLG